MTLKLESVEISNFRSCANIKLELSSFTPLIGYNNAGKSNCLTAIQWLLRKSSLSHEDFTNTDKSVEVVGIISGLTNEYLDAIEQKHANSIRKYISLNNCTLKIKRVQDKPNAKSSDIKLLVWDETTSTWTPNPTGIDNALNALLPEPIRIGAMEDANEDVTKSKTSTTIGKLLSLLTNSIKDQHEIELAQHLNKVSSHLSSNGLHRFSELNTIDSAVNEKIENFFPGINIKLHFETPSFEDLFKSGTIKVIEDNFEEKNFSSYGHGAQRSIQMALIQYLAEIKKGTSLGTTLLLIDEPELYLHPFAIEQIRETLITLSDNGYQVIVSTHSAQMVTSKLAANALLIRKENHITTVRTRLTDAVQAIIKDRQHQTELLFTLTNSSQILFADKVLLVEGKTEQRLLPFIFNEITNKTLGQSKYALIPLHGVDNTRKTMDILSTMGIPTKAICDLDYIFDGAIKHDFIQKDDPDLLSCKAKILSHSSKYNIILNDSNGLPKKTSMLSVSESYEKLASEEDIQINITNIHNKLKLKNVWLWKTGAIEAPLGISAKNEKCWSQFKQDTQNNSIASVCRDYTEIVALINWIISE